MAGEDELPVCGFCRKGKEVESICGELHVSTNWAAHLQCMQYSPALCQYRFIPCGGFYPEDVQKELRRGRGLICHICKPPRNKDKKPHHSCATSGCALPKCRKTFHFYCVHQAMHEGGEAIYKRYGKVHKCVKYRVFCSEPHQREYEETDKWTGTDTEELSPERSFPTKIEDGGENSPGVVRLSRTNSTERKRKVFSKIRNSTKASNVSDDSDSEIDQEAMNKGRLAKKSNKKKHFSSKASTTKAPQKRKVRCDSSDSDSILKKRKTRYILADKPKVKQKSVSNGRMHSKNPAASKQGEKYGKTSTADATKTTKKIASPAASNSKNKDLGVAANDVHIEARGNNTTGTSESPSTTNYITVGSRKKMQSCKTYPDCLLFFAEGSTDVNDLITRVINIADEEYTIDEKCVFNWQRCVPSSPLTTHQMLYYTKLISEALKNEWTNEIIRLICDLNGKDMLNINANIDYGNRLRKEIQTQKPVTDSVHKQTESNLKEFNKRIGKKVTFLHCVEDDDSFVTVIVLLNKQTDSDGRIRGFLLKDNKTELFLWSDNDKLVPHLQYSSSDLEYFQRAEAEILYPAIFRNDLEVVYRPQEDIFSGSCKSIVYDWKTELAARSDPDASTMLMLFGPLDPQLAVQKAYYTKILQHHVPEAMDAGKTVICAIDVQNLQLNFVSDIIPPTLRDTAHVHVRSAFDPDMFPVTCLLLKFTGKHTPRITRHNSATAKAKTTSKKQHKKQQR